MGKVEPFPQPKNLQETLEELVEKTHELAKDSGNVYWDNPHVQLRMKERSVTMSPPVERETLMTDKKCLDSATPKMEKPMPMAIAARSRGAKRLQ